MGTIKFEIDLPEFEKELSLNLIIRRDGEVIYNTSSSSTNNSFSKNNGRLENSVEKVDKVISPIVEGSGNSLSNNSIGNKIGKQSITSKTPKGRGGNLMNLTDI